MINLIEFIEDFPAEKALFGSYTLSLGFFDSLLLSRLGPSCDEITLLVGADGYRSSLREQRSAKNGIDYRILPVIAKSGVFHPKFALLEGDSEMRLYIGSGNLSFGGYGRNLEVAEVFSSAQHPTVFKQFGQFLKQLQSADHLQIPQSAKLTRWIHRCEQTTGPDTSEGIELIHCVNQPIIEQLSSKLKHHGRCERLMYLSPFHDSDGHSVRALAEALDCGHILIGVKGATSFPLETAEAWSQKVSAVELDWYHDGPLHAKWIDFHFEDGSKFSLTGSINATRQALRTTNNVELGVLRSVEETGPTYEISQPKLKQPDPYTSGESKPIVYAELSEDWHLKGELLLASSPQGSWQAWLECGLLEKSPKFELQVASNGSFEQSIEPWQASKDASIQLVLYRNDQECSGWVNQEMILNLPKVPGLSRSTFSRLQKGLADSEELDSALNLCVALLVELLESIQSDPPDTPQEASNQGATPSQGLPEALLGASAELHDLDPSEIDTQKHHPDSSPLKLIDQLSTSIYRQILKKGPGARGNTGGVDEAPEDDARENEDNERKIKEQLNQEQRRAEQIDGLIDTLEYQLTQTDQMNLRQAIYFVWGQVAWATGGYASEIINDYRQDWVKGWYGAIASESADVLNHPVLPRLLMSSVARLACLKMSLNEQIPVTREQFEWDSLKDAFDLALSQEPPKKPRTESAGGLCDFELIEQTFRLEEATCRAGLAKVAQWVSARQKVAQILNALRRGEEPPKELLEENAWLKKLISHWQNTEARKICTTTEAECPCGRQFSSQAIIDFQRYKFTRCESCRRLLIGDFEWKN